MGSGPQFSLFSRDGFEVRRRDISPEAVETARQLARANGVTLRADIADLEKNYLISPATYI